MPRYLLRLAACLFCGLASDIAVAQTSPDRGLGPGLASIGATAPLLVEPIAERVVERLPSGPLHWRVERFSSLAAARAVQGPTALAAEAWGQAWLFTLDRPGGETPGGVKAGEVGPVPIPPGARLLLRVNRAGGPSGAKTPVHTHPGSEAFYVLKGQLTQRTAHGVSRVDAGSVMNGHQPGMAMQLTSTGAEPLEQLVMFVADADKPFSTPARLEAD